MNEIQKLFDRTDREYTDKGFMYVPVVESERKEKGETLLLDCWGTSEEEAKQRLENLNARFYSPMRLIRVAWIRMIEVQEISG